MQHSSSSHSGLATMHLPGKAVQADAAAALALAAATGKLHRLRAGARDADEAEEEEAPKAPDDAEEEDAPKAAVVANTFELVLLDSPASAYSAKPYKS